MSAPRRGSASSARATLPLFRRFPALSRLPRVALGRYPTPVVQARALAPSLWIKREDVAGEPLGGNKVRSLEFLLGGVEKGDRVVTVGAFGSTHALATAIYARRLGARALVYRWPQEMNAAAERIAERIDAEGDEAPRSRSIVGAYLRGTLATWRGARWIPAGGSAPLGILGQVNAALELADQIATGVLPAPARIVVPLGSGGTAAGLLLGAAIAGIEAEIVGVRVVPRIVANRRHVLRLAAGTARLIERLTDQALPALRPEALRVDHEQFGGAYGRPTPAGEDALARCSRALRLDMDPTYSAKALAAALLVASQGSGATLFWLTFDGRS